MNVINQTMLQSAICRADKGLPPLVIRVARAVVSTQLVCVSPDAVGRCPVIGSVMLQVRYLLRTQSLAYITIHALLGDNCPPYAEWLDGLSPVERLNATIVGLNILSEALTQYATKEAFE